MARMTKAIVEGAERYERLLKQAEPLMKLAEAVIAARDADDMPERDRLLATAPREHGIGPNVLLNLCVAIEHRREASARLEGYPRFVRLAADLACCREPSPTPSP